MTPSKKKSAIRVLHVDDDASLREITKLMLLDLNGGFEIDCVCCVDEGFKKLSAGSYDVVVSDYEMPQKDGLQFLRELREQNNKIPFILFTGKGREEVAIKALNLGADGYINKQGNPETVYGELAHDIAQLLNQNRLKTELAESEVRFKQFFSNLPNAVAVYEAISNGEDFVFNDFNAAAEKIEKTSKADVIGKRVTDVFPGAKDFGILEIFNRVWKTGQSEYFSTALYQDKRDTGSWRENWIFKLPNGNVVAVYNDVTERIKNDLELKRTNDVLERVGEGVDAGLAVIGKDYHVVWANKRLMDLGVAPNKKCYQTFNSLDTVCPDCGVKKVFEQNISLDVHEYKTKNSNGETVWVELRVTPLKDKDGNVTAALELAVDITERKRAKMELQESEERYRSLFEQAPLAVAISDLDGIMLDANGAMLSVTGYSLEELKKNPAAYLYENSQDRKTLIETFKQDGKVSDFSTRIKQKDGNFVNVVLNVSKFQIREVSFLRTTIQNVTERKEAEDGLRESEEKYRKLFEESMDAILVADIETGIIVDSNLAASKLFGRQNSELISQHQSIITPQEQMDGEFARVFKQHLQDQTKTLETQIMRKTGEIRDVAVRDSIFELKGKKLMQGTFRDITDLKKANEQLFNMKAFDERIIDSLGDALLIIDPEDFTILNANKIAHEQLKLERKDIVGKTCWETTHLRSAPCEPPNHVCPIQEMKRTGKPVIVEHTHFDSQQNEVIVEISAYPVKNEQGKTVVIHISKDITQRKLLERDLKESEVKFRGIANSVRDAIVLVDDHAKVTYWNPTAEKIFGYSNKEAIGKDVHQLVVPPTVSKIGRECIEIGVKTFTETGEGNFTAGNVELVGLRKNGSEFPAELSLSPVNLGGKWSAVGVIKDITESKQAEQKLLEAEKRYHTLFSQAPLGVLIIDPQTEKAVEFNGVAHNQLGYSREEFSRLRISDFEAKKTEDEINTQKTRILTTGGDEFETKHRAKNGEVRDVLVTVKVIELEGKSLFNCVFHDITEIKKIQNALTESEKQYRQLVSAAQEGIWALDNNYQSVFVNPRMVELLGYAESEMVGKNLFEFVNKKCVDRAMRVLGQFKQGVKDHFDCELGRKNDSVIYVSIAVSVIKDDEGKPSGMLLMVSDITDRKVLEAKVDNYSKHLKSMVDLRTVQLKDANERLVKSERLAAIGELAGMVGHDLRNPLAGIKNAVYYLKKKGTTIPKDQIKEMFETIEKAITHSDKIINDLLDYAREMHLELTKCAAHALVDEAIGMVQVPNRIQIVNHVQGETWIWINSDKMMRVFINFIKNAVDAIPEKGTLEITSHQTRDCVEITFADTGTGIPEETLKKLFTPLFTTKAQGMGFGLAICKRIIEAHGGTINVKTELNKGTTFTVTLPLKPKVDNEGKKPT